MFFFIAALSRSSADFARSSARDVAPMDAANAAPCFSLSVSEFDPRPPTDPKNAPLSPTACWNKSRESGEAINALTDRDPADSPPIVTLCESPPNAAMFFRTHSSAAT